MTAAANIVAVRELKEQTRRVREYWRSPPAGRHLSAEGATLLSMIENLPTGSFVISRELLEVWLHEGLACQDHIAQLLREPRR